MHFVALELTRSETTQNPLSVSLLNTAAANARGRWYNLIWALDERWMETKRRNSHTDHQSGTMVIVNTSTTSLYICSVLLVAVCHLVKMVWNEMHEAFESFLQIVVFAFGTVNADCIDCLWTDMNTLNNCSAVDCRFHSPISCDRRCGSTKHFESCSLLCEVDRVKPHELLR